MLNALAAVPRENLLMKRLQQKPGTIASPIGQGHILQPIWWRE
ncbi:hypothetical protein ACNKHP_07300 [Shigella boydii]